MYVSVRGFSRAVLMAAATLLSLEAAAEQVVRIGAAHFPPYTIRPEKGEDTGLLPELAAALNAAQHDYKFVLVPTSIPRRFRDLEQGRVDMAIFENPDWGWERIAHQAVDMKLEDAEIFVTRKVEGREQTYFNDFHGKRLALFSGYHYAFAQFNADPAYLAENFNVTLTYSHDSNLLMVLRGRADIALVTRSYLSDFLARNPSEARQLLVSERIDQVYRHYALLRPGSPITAERFDQLLAKLRDSGQMQKIFQPYRIAVTSPLTEPSVVGKQSLETP
jgi:ABC-type amino acid transport substrate-binding protein